MMCQLLILSDIHGNVSALNCVLNDAYKNYSPDAAVVLGDNIDYGMGSNEVLTILNEAKIPIISSIWGNHENAIMNQDYSRFSSQRGVESAKYTRSRLNRESFDYLNSIPGKSGWEEFKYRDKLLLSVHGTLEDVFWGSLSVESNFDGYEKYDYVLSGHSHISHVFPVFYKTNDVEMRNKKKTVFINPGSVGQPRNHDPYAQYAVLDFDAGITLRKVKYDIGHEQRLYTSDVDPFYKERLSKGV